MNKKIAICISILLSIFFLTSNAFAQNNFAPSDLELELETAKTEVDKVAQESINSNIKVYSQIIDNNKLVNITVSKTISDEEKLQNPNLLLPASSSEVINPYVQK